MNNLRIEFLLNDEESVAQTSTEISGIGFPEVRAQNYTASVRYCDRLGEAHERYVPVTGQSAVPEAASPNARHFCKPQCSGLVRTSMHGQQQRGEMFVQG